ncbi:hypothetical protein CLOSTASPAR_01097 [[Clostridium] asparagiforme DSM 15981]|uniref:Uncharacterized protein n=1 Tax=[Clostridium] asparagiforme DSM 15981 TaxID=518636 RepID=C0CVU3_9FIRM|nr:hypothetical protein CLOSTASPAR_01097 [[Clostridium] asparagiforme DSM 15981]
MGFIRDNQPNQITPVRNRPVQIRGFARAGFLLCTLYLEKAQKVTAL